MTHYQSAELATILFDRNRDIYTECIVVGV